MWYTYYNQRTGEAYLITNEQVPEMPVGLAIHETAERPNRQEWSANARCYKEGNDAETPS